MNTNGSVPRKENVMTWLPVFHAIRMVVLLHLVKGEPIRKSLARGFHNSKGLTLVNRAEHRLSQVSHPAQLTPIIRADVHCPAYAN
jgi:hypothetical protein